MRCAAKGRNGTPCKTGRVQEHHAIPQQRIRRLHNALKAAHRRGGPTPPSLSRLLNDRRNLIGICKRHHELVTLARLRLHAEDLPDGAWEFARTLDELAGRDGAQPFTAQLEAEYPRRAAA